MNEETNTLDPVIDNSPQPGPSKRNEHGNEILVNADDDDRWNEGGEYLFFDIHISTFFF